MGEVCDEEIVEMIFCVVIIGYFVMIILYISDVIMIILRLIGLGVLCFIIVDFLKGVVV